MTLDMFAGFPSKTVTLAFLPVCVIYFSFKEKDMTEADMWVLRKNTSTD